MRIALCDDDTTELEKIKKTVAEFIDENLDTEEITVNTFSSGDDVLRFISKFGGFDLLILDIVMPGMNGIELATEIRLKNGKCKIIFLTSSPEYAVNSYKVNAFHYLIKPLTDIELKLLLKKVMEELVSEESDSIVVKEKGKLTRVQISKIKYLESIKHTIVIHLKGDDKISSYGTMNEFYDALLVEKCFIKCHKSFIMNMNYVQSITNKDFILIDKTLVPISKLVYTQVKNIYIDYFFEKGNDFL